MAQKVQVVLIDDIDGGDADETVTFALDGVTYEIDLNDRQRGQAARRPRGLGRQRPPRERSRLVRPQRVALVRTPVVRQRGLRGDPRVGQENGHQVSERGRISAEVREAYAKAH